MSTSFNSNPPEATPREWLLVVDDDAPIRQMVASCLSDENIDVVTASTGAEALHLLTLRATEPVLSLVDVLMPGIDGLTLARRMQSRFKRGKIVIMSGHMTDMSWWPVDLREIEFMPKPFRLASLMEHLASARANYQGKK